MSTPRDSSDDLSPEQQQEEGEIISPQRAAADNEEVTAGDGGEGRKREREDDSVASSSGTRPRRKGELDVPRSVDPACYVCGKHFASWKAVFGHLRSHPRAHSGAFPPPKFSPDSSPNPKNKELQDQLAPTLLNLAREALENMEQDQEATPDAAAVSRHRGLGVDLNDPIRTDSSDDESFPRKNGGHETGLDLNKAPNENEGDGNDAAAN